jgi:hypothetical protein
MWAHKTRLTPPFFYYQARKVCSIHFIFSYTTFRFDFGTVPTVGHIVFFILLESEEIK